MREVLVEAVAWLRDHPHSTARQVREGLDLHRRDQSWVYGLLERAERDGWVQRTRTGSEAWRWEAVPLPRSTP